MHTISDFTYIFKKVRHENLKYLIYQFFVNILRKKVQSYPWKLLNKQILTSYM